MRRKPKIGSLCLSLAAGIIISISAPMDVSAQDMGKAYEMCKELAAPGSTEQATCAGCVLTYMLTKTDNPDTRCKAYSSLNKSIASEPTKATKAIDPAEIERDVAEIVALCDRRFALNCQCWEKEYRESRANGLGKHAAQPTSQCYSKDRIKAYAYPRCARTQWKMIEQFESYCGCVAEGVAASIIEIGEGYENAAFLDAAKTCEFSQQQRLTPERGKERFAEYGRRGPTLDLQAYRKVP